MIASEVCLSSLHNLLLLIMRKIESQMIAAINSSKNWQSANTSVHFNEESNTSIVRLHGNKIAEVTDDSMTIFDGGWQTVTTKSRLNALINEFCNAVTDGVFQKNYQWFVTDNNVTKEFTNGYVFA
jgi:ribose 5-phosphate isomerase